MNLLLNIFKEQIPGKKGPKIRREREDDLNREAEKFENKNKKIKTVKQKLIYYKLIVRNPRKTLKRKTKMRKTV